MALSPAVLLGKALHYEAVDWATRATAAGGVVSKQALVAVSSFCKAIDLAGIRSAMYRCNLCVGGNLSGCLVPLYRGPVYGGTNYGSATDAALNFVSGDFRETGGGGGLKGNGVNKHLNTGLAINSLPASFLTSNHLSVSATNAQSSVDSVFMGSFGGQGGNGLFCLDEWANYGSAGGRAFRSGTYATGQFPAVLNVGSVESHIIGSRTSSTSSVLYRGGAPVASNATSLTLFATAFPIYVFTLNTINNAVSAGCLNIALRMYSIGSGLDATQAAAFSDAVIAFNAALGRA